MRYTFSKMSAKKHIKLGKIYFSTEFLKVLFYSAQGLRGPPSDAVTAKSAGIARIFFFFKFPVMANGLLLDCTTLRHNSGKEATTTTVAMEQIMELIK